MGIHSHSFCRRTGANMRFYVSHVQRYNVREIMQPANWRYSLLSFELVSVHHARTTDSLLCLQTGHRNLEIKWLRKRSHSWINAREVPRKTTKREDILLCETQWLKSVINYANEKTTPRNKKPTGKCSPRWTCSAWNSSNGGGGVLL